MFRGASSKIMYFQILISLIYIVFGLYSTKSKLRFSLYDLNIKDLCFVSTLLHRESNANPKFKMACFLGVVPHFRGSVPKLVE